MTDEPFSIRRSRPYDIRLTFRNPGTPRARSVIRKVMASTEELAHDLARRGARFDRQMLPDAEIRGSEIIGP